MSSCKDVTSVPRDLGDIDTCSISVNSAARDPVDAAAPGLHRRVPQPHKKKSSAKSFQQWVGECFFPDDPLHKLKMEKTTAKKLALGLRCLFPILTWGSDYTLKLLKSDIIAGLTISSMAIPQGVSYAKLANLPPMYGLYSSFVPPLIYLILGSSRDLAVGPSSIISVVLGSMLSLEVSPEDNPLLYLQLALTTTFFAGIFQASLGILRFGFVVEFLSKPTLAGFTAGAAIITILQQLKGLTGILHFTKQTGILPVLFSVFNHVSEWNLKTMLMGFTFLILLIVARQISSKRPKLFLISATAPLISVIISTIIIFAFKSETQGIKIVGRLPEGINPLSVNMIHLHGSYFMLTIKAGIITGILSLTEGIAVGRTFASLKDYQIDGNKEMMAIGIMNLMGSFSSCFVTTGSFSRSAVNYNAGSKTAISNLIMAFVVLITMMVLMPLFYYTPNVILSVTIIVAVMGLIDMKVPLRLWKVDKLDFIAYVSAFLGVLFISVPMGLAIAVGVSLIKILLPLTRPNIAIMGNVLETQCYRSIGQYKDAIRIPHLLILSIEFPIYFASTVYLQERILRWIRDEEERAENVREDGIKYVILDISGVTKIDISGIDALLEIKKTLNKRSLKLLLANPMSAVAEKLFISEAWESLGSENIFMNVADAVASAAHLIKSQK